jgi:hypothetical protein
VVSAIVDSRCLPWPLSSHADVLRVAEVNAASSSFAVRPFRQFGAAGEPVVWTLSSRDLASPALQPSCHDLVVCVSVVGPTPSKRPTASSLHRWLLELRQLNNIGYYGYIMRTKRNRFTVISDYNVNTVSIHISFIYFIVYNAYFVSCERNQVRFVYYNT